MLEKRILFFEANSVSALGIQFPGESQNEPTRVEISFSDTAHCLFLLKRLSNHFGPVAAVPTKKKKQVKLIYAYHLPAAVKGRYLFYFDFMLPPLVFPAPLI